MFENAKEHAMKLITWLLVALFGFVSFPPAVFSQSSEKPEELAQKSAEAWLSLTDSGKYAESSQSASMLFRANVSQPQFVSALTGARQPLGKLLSRKLKSATYTKTLPGAPDGEYVVIQFDTSFADKATAVETITPMLDKDGQWRVSGYYIK
jgi:Protein of unknown function (DUF4019)